MLYMQMLMKRFHFEKTYVKISWNPVNNDTATMKNKAGDMMKVGYEVVCDGNTKVYNMPGLFLDASDGTIHEMITSDAARLPYVILNSGQQVSVKVRAVYYHEVQVTNRRYIGTGMIIANIL